MPTNASGSNITVIKAPSQSTGPNLGGGGSEVPSRPPGSGDPAKGRILGLPRSCRRSEGVRYVTYSSESSRWSDGPEDHGS